MLDDQQAQPSPDAVAEQGPTANAATIAIAQTANLTPTGVLPVTDPIVLVLAAGQTPAAVSNTRGHLFEAFVARLLHIFGYNEPATERLNVTADGIELDVVARHDLTGQQAIAECKAYTSPVSAAALSTFHSKLVTRRYAEPQTQGFFVAIPRLTANGRETANLIIANDAGFKVVTASTVVELLRDRNILTTCPVAAVTSDPAVVITEHGVHAACLELDAKTRKPSRVLVWAADGSVPMPVLDAVAADAYAQSCPVVDARGPAHDRVDPTGEHASDQDSVIVTVAGSRSDFEYQLPASPRFFVGRKDLIRDVVSALDDHTSVLVLNAQSGWGKSSAALRLQALMAERRGHALVVDSRTAVARRFVADTLSLAARQAQSARVLTLPADASWASLPSAIATLGRATWHAGPLVVFFDQFENVFRDEALTREFRNLALSTRELEGRLLIGYAWKTDLVGWTESHPYRLRDEIRANATVLTIGPLGATEVDTLLRRLKKELGAPLARDLRTRLREYSQGLPWLFKKLAGHLLREVQQGATQEQLASEALNVQGLFDADLAELSRLNMRRSATSPGTRQ